MEININHSIFICKKHMFQDIMVCFLEWLFYNLEYWFYSSFMVFSNERDLDN